jgi:acyl-CoA synthetase (AMP-forming)/AMP-acid ligase II
MPGTVVDTIRDRASVFLGNVALIENNRALTYEELFDEVDRLSSALASLGLKKGDRVLGFLPNVHEAVVCELAALQCGFAWVTLTARLTWAEVRGVVVASAPKLMITTPEGAATIAKGRDDLPLEAMPQLVVTGTSDGIKEPALGYRALLAAHRPVRPRAHVRADDIARLRYTSGTMGGAKAAILPHRVYHASLENLLHELTPMTADDRVLHVAPLTHGSGALLYPVLYAGGTNVLEAHFDAEAALASIERHRISLMFTVPTMLSRLVSAASFDARDLSSLRALIYGGAPMPEARQDAAVEKIGRALFQIYGMTEAPWPITVLRPEDHHVGSARLRSVGRSTTVCEVRTVDADRRSLPANATGEIEVRGQNVMSGYLADDAGTRAVLHDGWLATGDLGRIDEDGYLFIVGREKDVIISGGFNVYAAEVEAALSAHEGVLEAAVVGLPHDDWGELVAAVVVPKAGARLTVAEIDALARSRLSGYKCPRRIELMNDLPKNASGKIQKSEIVRLLGG